MPDVRIVDLEIIKRFSLAVRTEFADAAEVLEALEASLREVRTVVDGGKKRTTRRKKSTSRSKTSGTKKRAASKKKSSRTGAKK